MAKMVPSVGAVLRPSASGSGYAFLAGIGAWSEGVIAQPGYRLVRVTPPRPVNYHSGLELIAAHLRKSGRPRTALCAIELRMSIPLTLEGFRSFNEEYFERLAAWGLMVDGLNPVARTNVAVAGGPDAPTLHAFAYAAPFSNGPATFVVAGTAELKDNSLRPETIVRRGETTPDAIREKAAHVMSVVARRMRDLGVTWSDATEVCLYTMHAVEGVVRDVIAAGAGPAARHGIKWYVSRPPFEGIEIEIDVRGIAAQEPLSTDVG